MGSYLGNREKASAHRIASNDRHMAWIQLRRNGLSYQEIGDVYGVTRAAVHMAVIRLLDRREVENVQQLRDLENERLDTLWAVHYPKALEGDDKAFYKCLKLSERRSRLNGLDTNLHVDLSLAYNQTTIEVKPVDYREAILPLVPEHMRESLIIEGETDEPSTAS